MAIRILVALLIPPALGYLGIIGWQLTLIAELSIILLAAWNFDRSRRPGAPGPVWDAARPDFPVQMGGNDPIPTEAVESPANRSNPVRPGRQP